MFTVIIANCFEYGSDISKSSEWEKERNKKNQLHAKFKRQIGFFYIQLKSMEQSQSQSQSTNEIDWY